MDPKLADLDSRFRPKCAAVLRDLQGKGWQVRIAEGRRTWKQQLAKVDAGLSKTMYSKHLAGMAADIVDCRWGWNMPLYKKLLYIKHIASSCRAHGLTSGSIWKRAFGRYGDWAHIQLGE